MHKMLQLYLNTLYAAYDAPIKKTMALQSNQTYGEIYYESVVKLLAYLNLNEKDHFLDIGSGLGKVVFYFFFLTSASSVTGIEISSERNDIACKIKEKIEQDFPLLFQENKQLNLINDDFLHETENSATVVYICSTVFSYDLLSEMGKKINAMKQVRQIISFRRLPHLDQFKLRHKLFLQCSWDNVPCFIYTKKCI